MIAIAVLLPFLSCTGHAHRVHLAEERVQASAIVSRNVSLAASELSPSNVVPMRTLATLLMAVAPTAAFKANGPGGSHKMKHPSGLNLRIPRSTRLGSTRVFNLQNPVLRGMPRGAIMGIAEPSMRRLGNRHPDPLMAVTTPTWEGGSDDFEADDGITFEASPGPLGIIVKPDDSGEILEVNDGGQAKQWGVKKGWRIVSVDNVPYRHDLIQQKRSTGGSYSMTFSKANVTQDELDLEKAQRKEEQEKFDSLQARPSVGDLVVILDTDVTRTYFPEGIGKEFIISSDAHDGRPYQISDGSRPCHTESTRLDEADVQLVEANKQVASAQALKQVDQETDEAHALEVDFEVFDQEDEANAEKVGWLPIKCVFFDFDNTISRIHVWKQVGGFHNTLSYMRSVTPPYGCTERGQINKIAQLNAQGPLWVFDEIKDTIVPAEDGSGERWTTAALGGSKRIEMLRSLFEDMKAKGVEINIATKGYVGATRKVLQEEGLLVYMDSVVGRLGNDYKHKRPGETPFDESSPVSELEGKPYCALEGTKAQYIERYLQRHGWAANNAILVEDDPREVKSVRQTPSGAPICRTVLVRKRQGMTIAEIERLRYLALDTAIDVDSISKVSQSE